MAVNNKVGNPKVGAKQKWLRGSNKTVTKAATIPIVTDNVW